MSNTTRAGRPARLPSVLAALLLLGAVTTARGQAPPYPGWGATASALTQPVLWIDANGDGRTDAVAVTSMSEVHVLTGDGFGAFMLSMVIPLPWKVLDVVAADFNGDGRTDIAGLTGSFTGDVQVLWNDGTGGFAVGPLLATGVAATIFGVGDLNADGRADVVAQRGNITTGYEVLAWLASPAGFAAPVVTSVTPSGWSHVLAVRDVTGDGVLDLLLPQRQTGDPAESVAVLAGDAAGGFAAWTLSPYIPGFKSITRMHAVDFDEDGDIDIIAENVQNWRILRNSGGVFSLYQGLSAAKPSGGGVLVDMDLDGDRDYVFQYSYFEDVGANFSGPIAAPHPAPTGGVARLNGDRWIDFGWSGLSPTRVYTALGNGPLSLEGIPDSPHAFFAKQFCDVGDFDGDGDLDVVRLATASPETIDVYANDGTGQLTALNSVAAPELFDYTDTEVADLDGDGRPDLALVSTWSNAGVAFRRNVGGALSAYSGVVLGPVGQQTDEFELADLDLDGDLDVVATIDDGQNPALIKTIRNTPFLGMVEAATLTSTAAVPFRSFSLEVADLDGDGAPEVLVTDDTAPAVRRFQMNPGPALTLGASTLVPCGARAWTITAVDRNADGLTDINATTYATGSSGLVQYEIILQSAPGTFAPPQSLSLTYPAPHYVSFVDVDLDGQLDAVMDDDGGLLVLRGADPTQLENIWIGENATDAVFAEMDGDPAPELVAVLIGMPDPVVIQEKCRGGAGLFGHACAGAGGFAPRLALTGCVEAGSSVTLDLDSAPGGSIAVLLFAAQAAPVPFATQCALEIGPVPLPLALVLPLGGSGPGQGAITAPATLPATLGSATFAMQAFVADPSTGKGYTATNGLEVVIP